MGLSAAERGEGNEGFYNIVLESKLTKTRSTDVMLRFGINGFEHEVDPQHPQ